MYMTLYSANETANERSPSPLLCSDQQKSDEQYLLLPALGLGVAEVVVVQVRVCSWAQRWLHTYTQLIAGLLAQLAARLAAAGYKESLAVPHMSRIPGLTKFLFYHCSKRKFVRQSRGYH